MKRFHVHLHVNNIKQNIAFYSAMFNQRQKIDIKSTANQYLLYIKRYY